MDAAVLPPEEQKKSPTLLERLLINRNYAYNWVGLATSRLGNVIFKISILLWVATTLSRNAPWAPFALGGLVFLPTAVFLVVSTVAGVYVDRWDARRTQLFMDAARAILFTLLLLATGILPLPFPAGSDAANLFQLACVYIAVMLNSACDPFVNSSLAIILYDIVDEDNLPRAFGRGQVLNNLGTIFGPALGAGLFFLVGIQWTIIINVFSFIVSFFAFYMIRLPTKTTEDTEGQESGEKAKSGFLSEFLHGLRFAFGSKMIVAIAFATLINAIGGAGIGVFDLYFATNNLHASPQFYAYLDVVMGVGAILGAIFVGPWLRPRIGMARAYWMSGIVNGLLLLLYSRLTNLASAFVVLFLYGISGAVFSVAFGPILFRSTPRKMMGRVNSVLAQLITIVSLVSLSFIPFLVAVPLRDKYLPLFGMLLGPIDILFMSVAILMITSALYLRLTLNHYAPELKRPLQQGSEGQSQPPESQPVQRSVLNKQIATCVVGMLLAVLIVLPVALSTPADAFSNLQLSRGQPASGQTINGIPCQPSLGSVIHANVRLTVYINGQAASVPVGIGSVAPSQPGVAALASNGKVTCLYALHTLESDNLIHVDAPGNRTYTLGDFFAIWGQPLSHAQVADYSADANHTLTFDVFDENGKLHTYAGDPRAIPLTEHETIVIRYNSPNVQPVPFNSWNGL